MSKYEPLWEWVGKQPAKNFTLTFAEIQQILGFPIDHSFLNYKKERLAYGYQVGKISMKKQTVDFQKASNFTHKSCQTLKQKEYFYDKANTTIPWRSGCDCRLLPCT